VIIIGNLGRDPDVKYLADGTAVANFSLATSENWTDKATGEKREKTEWHNVVAWRRLAEICGQYLQKGKQVYIEGSLYTEEWEKDGIKRYSTKIKANMMQMLGNRGDAGGGQGARPQGGYSAPQPQGGYSAPQQNAPQEHQQPPLPGQPEPGMDDEDIPF